MKKYYSLVLRFFLIFLLVFVAYVANAFSNPIPYDDPVSLELDTRSKVSYGVSYSFEQAEWYGLDPRESYTELMDELDVDWVRLPFFWDRYAIDGELNLEELEFAIREAAKRDVDVIVALGAKTPYYPEYHLPRSIRDQLKFGEKIYAAHPIVNEVLEIDREIVETLSGYNNIIFWQVENEPLIGNINKWKIDASLIEAEVDVVRSTDPKKRPVILNHAAVGFYDSSWKSLLPILRKGDVFAVNAFFKTQGVDIVTAKFFGREIHILWPEWLVWPVHSWGFLSPNLESIRKTVRANGNELWVLEMQAEPYVRGKEYAKGNKFSLTPDDLRKANKFLKSKGVNSIGFWGVHFWQFRQSLGDESWMEAVRQITTKN